MADDAVGEVGYDKIIYPNEKDTRSLLRFVVQKLPKAGDKKRGRGDDDDATNLLKSTDNDQDVINPHSINQPNVINDNEHSEPGVSEATKVYKKCWCLTCREFTCCLSGCFLSLIICIAGILVFILANSKSVSTETLGKPSPVTFINSSIGSDFIYLKWNPPKKTGGAYITSYTLQYKYKSNNWSDVFMVDDGLGLANNISNLNGSIYYTFRINANNLAGYTSNWTNISLVTNPPKKPQPPTHPFASDLQQNSDNKYEFTIAFTPSAAGGAPITEYSVYYGNYSNNTDYKLFCKVNSSKISKLHEWEYPNCTGILAFNDLSKLYNFKVKSINSVGSSSYSDVTPCIIPSDNPSYFMCLNIGPPETMTKNAFNLDVFPYEIDISWIDTTCSDTPVTEYDIQKTDFWTNSDYVNMTLPYNGLTKYVKIDNLLAGLPYNIRVRSHNKYGMSGWSYLLIETVENGKCGNYIDTKILRDNCKQFSEQAPAIWVQCNGKDSCQANQFENQYGFSSNCTSCWVQLNDCAMGVCVKQCLKNFNPQSCETCIINKCSPQTETCTGYPDWPIACPPPTNSV